MNYTLEEQQSIAYMIFVALFAIWAFGRQWWLNRQRALAEKQSGTELKRMPKVASPFADDRGLPKAHLVGEVRIGDSIFSFHRVHHDAEPWIEHDRTVHRLRSLGDKYRFCDRNGAFTLYAHQDRVARVFGQGTACCLIMLGYKNDGNFQDLSGHFYERYAKLRDAFMFTDDFLRAKCWKKSNTWPNYFVMVRDAN